MCPRACRLRDTYTFEQFMVLRPWCNSATTFNLLSYGNIVMGKEKPSQM
jgi:hypothetical protein